MIEPKDFIELLHARGVSLFAGVPDSLLKDICAYIDDNLSPSQHIITANEGGAVAVAAGHHLATDTIPVVYMQNSGLGNTINPLMSLVDPAVYSIPMLLIIGWRGEPGVPDEPQHIKQGPVTPTILEVTNIAFSILPESVEESEIVLEEAFAYMRENNAPYALLVRSGTFAKYKSVNKNVQDNTVITITREDALATILESLPADTAFVGTTGKLSRELYELREKRSESHQCDFLTVGSMGHASQISLGISEALPNKQIVCLDGDGAALMHLGGLATIGTRKPSNLLHIIINNGVHESVGGQCVTCTDLDYVALANSVGYKNAYTIKNETELQEILSDIDLNSGPVLINCFVKSGSREDLGRPKTTPKENKEKFKQFLNKL